MKARIINSNIKVSKTLYIKSDDTLKIDTFRLTLTYCDQRPLDKSFGKLQKTQSVWPGRRSSDLLTMVDRIIRNFPGVKLDTNTKKPIIGALFYSEGSLLTSYLRTIMVTFASISMVPFVADALNLIPI